MARQRKLLLALWLSLNLLLCSSKISVAYDWESGTLDELDRSALSPLSGCEEAILSSETVLRVRQAARLEARRDLEKVLESAGLPPEIRNQYRAARVNARSESLFGAVFSWASFNREIQAVLTDREFALVSGVAKTWSNDLMKELGQRLMYDFLADIQSLKRQSEFWSVQRQELGLRQLMRTYSLVIEKNTSVYARAAELAAQATTDVQARRVYELLLRYSRDREPKLVLGFLDASPFFREAVRFEDDPTLIVTTSFEKETFQAKILKYYKHSKFTNQQWRFMSDEQRVSEISEFRELIGYLHGTNKTPTAPSYFAENLKSESIKNGRHLYEVVQDRYALTPQETIRRVREVAAITGEMHSFHVHVVGEVPKVSEPEFSRFAIWHWEANIQSMLQGMEEGLFGTTLTGYPVRPIEGGTFARSDMNKLLTVGYRRDIYGYSLRRGFMKIGLELRDVTRKLEVLSDLILRFSRAMAGRIWKNTGVISYSSLALPDSNLKFILRGRGISEEAIDQLRFTPNYPAVLQLPLLNFHQMRVVDWKTGQMRSIDESVLARLDEGREYYLSGLVALGKEIDQYRESGTPVSNVELSSAIKMWLQEWAVRYRPREIYSAY